MKRIRIIFLAIVLIPFLQLQAQKRYLSANEVPQAIQTFITKNFPENKLISVRENQKYGKIEYKIKLTGKTKLKFDQNYKIVEIDSKTALPEQVIPQKIREYVAQHFPNHYIVEWEDKKISQKIELNNDLDIYFDRDGNFLKMD